MSDLQEGQSFPDMRRSGLSGNALKRAILNKINQNPSSAIASLDDFIDLFPTKEEKRGIVLHILSKHPQNALEYTSSYADYFSSPEMADIARDQLRSDPSQAIQFPDSLAYIPERERGEFVLRTAIHNPSLVISDTNFMDQIPNGDRANLIRQLSQTMPSYASVFAPLFETISSTSSQRELALEIAQHQLQSGYSGDLYSEYAYYPNFSSAEKNQIEQLKAAKNKAEEGIVRVNALHEASHKERFESVVNSTPEEIYRMMVLGRSVAYTSTYIGMMEIFKDKLSSQGKNVYDVMGDLPSSSILTFLEASASYNKVQDAVAMIPRSKWGEIINQLGNEIDQGNRDMSSALIDIMHDVDDPKLRAQLEQFVEQKLHSSSQPAKDSYAVIASAYNHQQHAEKIHMDGDPRYQFDDRTKGKPQLSQQEIKGKDGVFRQLSIFPGDDDGKASFDNWMRTFGNNGNYRIEKTKDYVKITPKSGEKMELYANIPGHSPESVYHAIGGPNGNPNTVEIDMLVNRGHSYNVEDTFLPFVSSNNSLVYLGSCNGYGAVDLVHTVARNAEVIATKETGTMRVNDPMLLHMTEQVRNGRPIVWEKERTYLSTLGSDDKSGYLMPDTNTALIVGKHTQFLQEYDKTLTSPQWMLATADRTLQSAYTLDDSTAQRTDNPSQQDLSWNSPSIRIDLDLGKEGVDLSFIDGAPQQEARQQKTQSRRHQQDHN